MVRAAGSAVRRASWSVLVAAVLVGCSASPPPDAMTAPMTAEQVRAEIDATKARIPLPPGAAWKEIKLDPNAGYGPYSGASMIEFQALCAWFLEARAAKLANDPGRTSIARTWLERIPSWRSFSDPLLMDENGRTIIREGAEAAVDGDFGPIGPFLQANCAG